MKQIFILLIWVKFETTYINLIIPANSTTPSFEVEFEKAKVCWGWGFHWTV
jgi:hypothetical protein